ncbi:MAG: alpha-2-macroglobulin [Phaeodactylibacter sp.]|nr:alpha-2-macroglobulin [Phaeodactylibacter sp.]
MTNNKFSLLPTLILFLAALIALPSCNKEKRARKMPESVSAYVYGYTSGIISRAAPIRVRFATLAAGEDAIGQEADSRLISFSPSIGGVAVWEDAQTLRFDPSEPLASGTAYVATVYLDKIIPDVPGEASSFEFDFRTRDQYLELAIDGISAPNPNDLSKQELQGALYTADMAEDKAVEATLTARQKGKELPIRWSHSAEGVEHYFYVEGISRGEQASTVKLSWDGQPLGVNTGDSREVEIPAIDDFKVTGARAVQGEEQYIQLYFSDPLLESQSLEGLVSIPGYGTNFRFIIDGNKLRIYPTSRLVGEHTVQVAAGVRNINDKRMRNPSEWAIRIQDVKPQVRLAGSGVIMPNSEGLIFPFEAVGLNAVEVEVFKIHHNNILQFLQVNELDGNQELYRVGRIIMQKKVPLLNLNPNASTSEWTRYALDLRNLIQEDGQAIYQIRIGFRPEYSTYFCSSEEEGAGSDALALTVAQAEEEEPESIMDNWYGFGGYYSGYSWEHREDPCRTAYYNADRFVQRNVIASNLGLIAKGGTDNSYMVVVSDLRTAAPLSGAKLQFYDFQQQKLTEATTDGQGMAKVELPRKPFVVIAEQGGQRGYLRLEDGNSLSLSRFDVSGAVAQKGLKGFLYGERGVWRPGDSVYLDFILEDQSGKLPPNYPVTFELRDPRGQLQERRSVAQHVNYIYPLHFTTRRDDPTGAWMATVKAGGATFEKTIRIETIKPNRIKIELDFGAKELSAADEPLNATLTASWLHGAPAANLDAKVEAQLRSGKTTFEGYSGYIFDDPARSVESQPATVFDGTLDAEGKARLQFRLAGKQPMPGKLTANFKTRVFERGGDFSTDSRSLPYHPYEIYAGIRIPESKYGEKRLEVNQRGNISFATLNKDGKPAANRRLSVGLYRVEWRWWWDQGYDDISRFNSSSHYDALLKQEVSTNAKGQAEWGVTPEEWGRYLVRVCDTETGHCTGDFFYAGYPWYGEGDEANRQAAAMLNFATDKEKYNVGEQIKLTLPEGEAGKVLITVENGTKVLESFWAESKEGENTFTFQAKPEMAPTAYAHVAMIQPHAQVKNDLPIRMYGVIPVNVEDPATRLAPKIKMPEELKPEQTFTVEVSEAKGQPMAYTLAIVDEGLLGLTRFETPSPWDAFYAKEALGVRTWDVYDQVLGAYGAELERLLSIGGDGEIRRGAQEDRANRFEPVAMHLGPFLLKKGKTAKHEIRMPNYVGAVRAMVVVADNGAYGNAEKTVPVRQPLMVLATLPRVLSPGEQLELPVNVFAMDNKVKNATISVQEKSGLVKVGAASRSVQFSRPGDRLVSFPIEVKETVGVARFTISASGDGQSAKQEIEIQVRNPNPYVTDVDSKVLDGGQSHTFAFTPIGMRGTNEAILEVSSIPPINLGERLEYVLRYPYGCLEQTLSGGFPQLYVNQLLELDEAQKERIPRNINATIDRLKQFQVGQGGFAYWPGGNTPDHWATSYAGHFLLEAKALGYTIPPAMLEKWTQFQKKAARMWDPQMEEMGFYSRNNYELMQAYRLYTLALAKEPDMAAMNRLREYRGLTLQASWTLAAAYAAAGKPEAAQAITKNLDTKVPQYQELSYTYGSGLRDRAMILETLVLMGERERAATLVRYISDELSSSRWCSTQEISFSLLAIGKYVGKGGVQSKLAFTYQVQGGQTVNAGSSQPVMQIQIPLEGQSRREVMVKNTGQGTLFTRVIRTGQPLAGQETASSNDLRIDVAYKDMKGTIIDPAALPQGTDFIAEVRITHPGTRPIPYRELALSQVFPSGWEIINTRMDNIEAFTQTNSPDYQDIRDDRVNTFFGLQERQTDTYRVQLNAAYQGRFYLPATSCAAMYDNSINARAPGRWVEVTAPREI